MNKVIKVFIFCATLVQIFPCLADASDDCSVLELTITGNLSSEGDTATPDLLVDISQLGDLSLKPIRLGLRPHSSGLWQPQISNSDCSQKAGYDPKYVYDAGEVINFRSSKQHGESGFIFQPCSEIERVARSRVLVRFKELTSNAATTALKVLLARVQAAPCLLQGVLDVDHLANGGFDTPLLDGVRNLPGGFRFEPDETLLPPQVRKKPN